MGPDKLMEMLMQLMGSLPQSGPASQRQSMPGGSSYYPQNAPASSLSPDDIQRLKWHLEDQYGIRNFDSGEGKEALQWMIDRKLSHDAWAPVRNGEVPAPSRSGGR